MATIGHENIKNRARVAPLDALKIRVGSTVLVRLNSGQIMKFAIGNPHDTAPEMGIISYESPLGRALLGKTIGEKAEYSVEDRTFKIEVVEVFE